MKTTEQTVKAELWDLPANERKRFIATLGRALRRRCPYCGGGEVFRGYLALKEHCPTCGVAFEREEGYFLGAYALNLVVSEIVGLGLAIFLIFRTDARHLDLLWQAILALGLAIAFPLLLFPFAREVWMAMDLTFHPPRGANERQLRGTIGGVERDQPG